MNLTTAISFNYSVPNLLGMEYYTLLTSFARFQLSLPATKFLSDFAGCHNCKGHG